MPASELPSSGAPAARLIRNWKCLWEDSVGFCCLVGRTLPECRGASLLVYVAQRASALCPHLICHQRDDGGVGVGVMLGERGCGLTQGSRFLSLMLTIVPAAFTAGFFSPVFEALPPSYTRSHVCVDLILGSPFCSTGPFLPFLGPDSR